VTRPTLDELRERVHATAPKRDGKQRGLYAAPPGSGPPLKTCGDCAHLRFTGSAKHYPKCGLVKFTHGDATTIRMRSPACAKFEQHVEPTSSVPR
jgi:hypothetical protein